MLDHKVALVTGAAKGIGRAIAIKLAAEGATVLVNYCGSEEKAKETVSRIREAGGQAESIQCNVADYQKAAELADWVVQQFGRLDILVNNAGITRDDLILKMSEEDYDVVLDTNLKGAFNMIRHFSKVFLKQKSGKIINISSVSGVIGNAGQANYCASKAGLIGLTKSVARELAGRGICVNAVAPGFIQTDMTEKLPESIQKGVLLQIPMKHMGQAEDIAETVAFLAGNGADYITGQVICVEGGMAI